MAVNRYYSSTAVATELTAALSSGGGSSTVASTSGWPTSFPCTGVLEEGTINEELVEVTNIVGLTVYFDRGIDGTSSIAHAAGATFAHCVSARDLREPQEHIAATTAVHGLGVGSAVVGTTDSQTLSNKTLTTPTIASLTNAQHDHSSAAQGGAVPQASVTGLVSALSGKASSSHTHAEADVTGLVADLDAKIPKSVVDAKGDIVTGTAADTPAVLTVGTDGYLLVAASGQATGLQWVAPTAYANPADSGWTAVSLTSPWTGTVHWRKIDSRVVLRGAVSRPSGSSAAVLTLPVGSRPSQSYNFIARESSSVVPFAIATSGDATVGSGYSNGDTVYLDNIAFYTD